MDAAAPTAASERRGTGVLRYAPAVVVAVGAAVATAHGLYEVAHASKVPGPIAWLYPLVTDGLALVAYRATARLHGGALRYAWFCVILAAGLSGLAQAVYLAADTLQAPQAIRFGVGFWPAVACALVAHLLHLMLTDTSERTDASAHQPENATRTPLLPPAPTPAIERPASLESPAATAGVTETVGDGSSQPGALTLDASEPGGQPGGPQDGVEDHSVDDASPEVGSEDPDELSAELRSGARDGRVHQILRWLRAGEELEGQDVADRLNRLDGERPIRARSGRRLLRVAKDLDAIGFVVPAHEYEATHEGPDDTSPTVAGSSGEAAPARHVGGGDPGTASADRSGDRRSPAGRGRPLHLTAITTRADDSDRGETA